MAAMGAAAQAAAAASAPATGQQSAAARGSATEVFDVLVIGGGVTGCGVALDAASRGLSVALVEKRDFAAGTSSRSSKLIHGGLRYLERMDFGLVREALHERRLLLETIAPHLVTADALPLPPEGARVGPRRDGLGPLPVRRARRDALGRAPAPPPYASVVPARRAVAARRCAPRRHPLLRRPGRRRALLGHAGPHGDRRWARSAPPPSTSSPSCGEATGSPAPACATSSQATSSRCARAVVNATGVWTTRPRAPGGRQRPAASCGRRRASTSSCPGPHRLRLRADPAHGEERALRAPWGDQWIIGTTDTDWSSASITPPRPAATSTTCSRTSTPSCGTPVVRRHHRRLRGTAAAGRERGGRHDQAVARARGATQRARPREHRRRQVHDVPPMAEDAVDAVSRDLPFPVDASRTATIPLLGAAGLPGARYRLNIHPGARPRRRTARSSPEEVRHARRRRARPVAGEPGLADPAPRRREVPGRRGQLRDAARGALHIDDVLTRRTHIAFDVAGPRGPGGRTCGPAHGPGPRLGRERRRPRGGALQGPARRREREPIDARTTPRPIRRALRCGTCGSWPSESGRATGRNAVFSPRN